jgi:hypothetical protein
MARFLEGKLELFTPDERYRVYWHIAGFFPQQLPLILAARLRQEKDVKCRDLLERIAAVPRDEISRAKVAKFCQELFRAGQLLRQHESGRLESEQNERQRDLRRTAEAHSKDNLDHVDMLVLFALENEPKDRGLFLGLVEDLTDGELLTRKETIPKIIEALTQFGQERRAQRLKLLGERGSR